MAGFTMRGLLGHRRRPIKPAHRLPDVAARGPGGRPAMMASVARATLGGALQAAGVVPPGPRGDAGTLAPAAR